MEHLKVYQSIDYLEAVRDATPAVRQTMLQSITRQQLSSFRKIAQRLINGPINPLRRDSQLFERRRLMLRTLASPRISFERKKTLINRHHSVVPSMLKSVYLKVTIVDEVTTARE